MPEPIFVERSYEIGDETLLVRFFQPFLDPRGACQCDIAIHWPGRVERRHIYGVDGVQALLLAMRLVHSILLNSDDYRSGRLTYLEHPDLDLPPL